MPGDLNISSAAEACKVRRPVIEKALRGGAFPNARFASEVWLIPIDDLGAAGFVVDRVWLKREERYRRRSQA